MIYTRRLIDCDAHGQQIVVKVLRGSGVYEDCCVKCVRDAIAADGRCACECGTPLGGHAAHVKYVDQRHRQRAHRADLKARAAALGVAPSLSVKTLDSATTQTNRRSDAQTGARKPTRPRKPQLRISYRKAVDAVEQAVADGVFEYSRIRSTRDQVEAVLGGLLTDRQRAAL